MEPRVCLAPRSRVLSCSLVLSESPASDPGPSPTGPSWGRGGGGAGVERGCWAGLPGSIRAQGSVQGVRRGPRAKQPRGEPHRARSGWLLCGDRHCQSPPWTMSPPRA